MLAERGTVRIGDLTSALEVSHITVRRDTGRLEQAGRIVSVSGWVSLPLRLALVKANVVKEVPAS